MNTIILATDFSANATQAAHFAAQLANDQKATLVLVHAYQAWPDNPAKTGDFPLSVNATREDSETRLSNLAHDLTKTFGAYTPIRYLVMEGHASDVIRQIVQTENADLLVMATIGTAPQSARLMGSLATAMVAETTVPLLLIPPGRTYSRLKKVVLGIDLASPPNALTLATALELTRTFGSTLNVICISDQLDDPKTLEQVAQLNGLLGNHRHSLTIQASDDDIYALLLAFAHQTEADLIMMLPQAHNWLDSLFVEGETQRLARLTDIPLVAVV
ncbi:universal stress protein [uncultured Fibrella sp.]|uniref:universal stress protein n=1 Tax=uncultured Fibrella sp. TaxID=1284596 RepID=UPI0035CA5B7C